MSPRARFHRLIIMILIAVSFFYGGFYYGQRGYEVEIKKNPPTVTIVNKNPGDQTIDFSSFWVVWDMVSSDYLDRPVDAEKMLQGAIKGMVDSLGDPYTAYLPPAVNEAVNDSLNSTYQGIGAELALKEGQLIIVAPLDGSPAKAAGIRPGDAILSIEDESTVGITISEAVATIRGDAGTQITLTIFREGASETQDITIERGVIKMDSVIWEDKGDGVAYIRVGRFGQDTNAEWSRVVKELVSQMDQLDSLVVDVRGNPGGYMLSAVYVAGEFFTGKPVLFQEAATGEQIPLDAKNNEGEFTDLPQVYVLIDGGSASAAEILAAALKDHIGAVLIGTKSFGKGTIQDARDFNDGSGIHITTGKWLTPSKAWLHENGLEPDIVVEITPEHIDNEFDAQLEKALELAREI